ncbi:porin [Ruegeria sp. 2205SS24-7]|uniref:porin n=1 Tax=Ruegeria discodermiae TaxID=3064389 RepID=UPI0027426BD0|nr:porin [Ruegeria sp. 2205SS24-7]MDP5215909.1 porin [Ruegeria sp. 2205SS24-7]
MTKTLRAVSLTALMVSAFAAPAAAELKYENNSGGYVKLYGQLNPAIISVDDGQETETNVRDYDASNSRVGLEVIQPYGANTFQFRFETALGLPNSTETSQLGNDFGGWTRQDIRHVDFSLKGDWGKVSAGQGSMFADGAAEQDLSYVGLALYSFTADSNFSFLFRDSAGVLSGPTVGDTTDDFDGSRRARIRYDTPSFNGFSFGAAWGRNVLADDDDRDYYDFGTYYSNEFAGTKVNAALAYQVREGDGSAKREDLIGSASVLLQSGLSFTVAAGTRDVDSDMDTDPNYYYAKVAYETEDWLPNVGKTGIGVHYWDGADFNTDGSDSSVWGVGVAQRIEEYNVDTYLTYQNYAYDDSTNDFDDLSTIVLGARWRF